VRGRHAQGEIQSQATCKPTAAASTQAACQQHPGWRAACCVQPATQAGMAAITHPQLPPCPPGGAGAVRAEPRGHQQPQTSPPAALPSPPLQAGASGSNGGGGQCWLPCSSRTAVYQRPSGIQAGEAQKACQTQPVSRQAPQGRFSSVPSPVPTCEAPCPVVLALVAQRRLLPLLSFFLPGCLLQPLARLLRKVAAGRKT
jgi:hypothetical protein